MLGLDLSLVRPAIFGGLGAPSQQPQGDGASALAYNLGGNNYFSTNQAFINLAKSMREWGASNGGDIQPDANGYPTVMPAGATYIRTTYVTSAAQEPNLVGQDLHLYWDGDATLSLASAATLSPNDPGEANHMVIRFGDGNNLITVTDLGTTGISNVRLIREDQLALDAAGEVFNPERVAILQGARELRFMDWLHINNNETVPTWAGRSTPARYTYADAPVPYDVILNLCNLIGADCYLNVLHRADTAYVAALAGFVRDNLDPALTCRLETTNEAWNPNFKQAQYFFAEGARRFGLAATGSVSTATGSAVITGTGTAFLTELAGAVVLGVEGDYFAIASIDSDTQITTTFAATRDLSGVPLYYGSEFAGRDAYVAQSTENALAWNAVHPTRTDHVLNVQIGSGGGDASIVLAAAKWQAADPAGWVDPTATFDACAVAPYYGSQVLDDEARVDALIAAYDSDPQAGFAMFDGFMRTDPDTFSMVDVAANLRAASGAIHGAGLKMIAYEGGVHTIKPKASIPIAKRQSVLDINVAYLASSYGRPFFDDIISIWKAFGDGPFMQFSDVGAWDLNGIWYAYPSLSFAGDGRTQALEAQKTAGRFWGDDVGPFALAPMPTINGQEFGTIAPILIDLSATNQADQFVSTDLPGGLTIDPQTGAISGTLAGGSVGAGPYSVTATHGASGRSATLAGGYAISAAPVIDPLDPQFGVVSRLDATDTALIGATGADVDTITDAISGAVFTLGTSNKPQTGVETLNGHNVIHCPTYRHYRMVGAPPAPVATLTDAVTIYAVYQSSNLSDAGIRGVFCFGARSDLSLEHNGATGEASLIVTTATGGIRYLRATPTGLASGWRVAAFRYDGATAKLIVGDDEASASLTGVLNNATTDQSLLSNSPSSVSFFEGRFADLIVCDQAHDDPTMANFIIHLRQKFGLA